MLGHQKHLDAYHLEAMIAGAGLGNATQNLLCLSIIYGLNQTVETLVSTAWGADEKELCGVYLNRGRFIMTLSFIPIIIILLNTKDLLISLGQSELAAEYA